MLRKSEAKTNDKGLRKVGGGAGRSSGGGSGAVGGVVYKDASRGHSPNTQVPSGRKRHLKDGIPDRSEHLGGASQHVSEVPPQPSQPLSGYPSGRLRFARSRVSPSSHPLLLIFISKNPYRLL